MVEQWTHKPLVGGSNPPFAILILRGRYMQSSLKHFLEDGWAGLGLIQ